MVNLEAGVVARPAVGDVGTPAATPPATPETAAVGGLWLMAAAGAVWRF